MALLYALASLKSEIQLPTSVVTIDHGLRDVSEELALVSGVCQSLGLSWQCERVVVQRQDGSFAADARRARLAKLTEVAGKTGCVAFGHTADDQAETVLLRLLRGTGLRGLRGITPVRAPFVRPLLELWRTDVIDYLTHIGAHFALDPTNNTDLFARNRLRHHVVPVVDKWFPGSLRHVAALATRAQADTRLIERWVDHAVKDCTVDSAPGMWALDVDKLRQQPSELWPYLFGRIVRRVTRRHGELYEDHVSALANLVRRPSGDGQADLPSAVAQRTHNRLQIASVGGADHGRVEPSSAFDLIVGPGCFRLTGGRFVTVERIAVDAVPQIVGADELWLDADRVAFPWTVRTWRAGDRMTLFGMTGTKKISDILIDAKVPRQSRSNILIIEEKDHVLWLAGVRRSALHPVVSGTTCAVRVRLY